MANAPSRIRAEPVRLVYFITHPDVVIDPEVPVPQWPLSPRGIRRMRKLLAQPWIEGIGAVCCSTEQKAIDGAEILAGHLSIGHKMVEELGEIDRSATGYLPQEEHAAAREQLFAHPDESIRGWETAFDAQRRIVKAVEGVIAGDMGEGHLAIVSHGGVGTFHLCHLKGRPISWEERQPGGNGGNYYCFEAESKALVHGWRPIDG
jgi:broad specificity phosphatase PhoE